MNAGDVALACSTVLLRRLARGGLAAAVVSPGSRSTPLALATAHAGGFATHVVLDERSAAFVALGIAKATGRPAVVISTSGTAAANFLPAVVEASQSAIPMIVLTADRPEWLRGTGANQTIDQVELYGRYPRLFVQAPLPAEGARTEWEALADQILFSALEAPAGPVHVNLPFDEPLVPDGDPVHLGDASATPAQPPQDVEIVDADVTHLTELFATEDRGVILAGELIHPAPSLAALAARAGWPLLAEPTSGLRAPGSLTAPGLLVQDDAFVARHTPRVVVQVGRAPTTRAAQRLTAVADRLIVVEQPGIPADPLRRAERRIVADPERMAARALVSLTQCDLGDWPGAWRRADAAVREAVDALLDQMEEPFEGRLARDVAAALPEGATLFVGNSTPVRDLDVYMAPRSGVRVLANRGASGIDGTVSTALGIATVSRPTVALLGDLAVLHDAAGLLWGARRARGFVLVVVDNGGGGIFDLLDQRALPEHERLFVTPHGADFHALAVAADMAYEQVARAGEVERALERALEHRGATMVHVPIDRAHALECRSMVRETLARAISAVDV